MVSSVPGLHACAHEDQSHGGEVLARSVEEILPMQGCYDKKHTNCDIRRNIEAFPPKSLTALVSPVTDDSDCDVAAKVGENKGTQGPLERRPQSIINVSRQGACAP